jgi:hypothetical protein
MERVRSHLSSASLSLSMDQSITLVYVGLDVHKDSLDIATADCSRDGEVRHVGSIGGDLTSLDKALRKLTEIANLFRARSIAAETSARCL